MFGIILLLGIVGAQNSLNGAEMSIPINNVVAGDTFSIDFDFGYIDDFINTDNSPLIIKLNVTSEDQENYPVQKGDFQISGYVEKYSLFSLLFMGNPYKTINFTCDESYNQVINHPMGKEDVSASEGTFYCYDAEGDLKLNEYDYVHLDITSNPALWPGGYNITAIPYYLTDTYAPIIQIINKEDFEDYYKEGNYVNMKVNITEYDLSTTEGIIETHSKNYSYPLNNGGDGFYYLMENLPNDIQEGDYLLNITAVDTSGNIGSDNVILKIDETGPVITLIQPNGIYDEMVPVELNVIDSKAGVDENSVQYRIREILNNGTICPESGVGFGFTCYNSGWMNTIKDLETGNFVSEFNSTLINSGSYWFEARAKDVLGNEGVL